jgi:2-polyprenyl-3-methyl-5-hydroxy-6-metoxy-1,4-benzoquinol methylase
VHTHHIDRTDDYTDNNAWYRQMAAGWARRMITGDSPGTWAQNTDLEIRFAVQQLQLRPGDRVLDLGCGWGRHSFPLAAYGLNVTSLDLSSELLTLARYSARRQNLSINWIEADITDLPLRGSFDAIAQFCGNLMTWFSTRERTLDVLWDVANLLRPGGRLLLGTEDWQPELPPRSQHWDEWQGGAAIYRQKYDRQCRVSHTQTVIFGPAHERHEYRRQTWWPSHHDMEMLFAQVGLAVCGKTNGFVNRPFDPEQSGLVYVLAREENG